MDTPGIGDDEEFKKMLEAYIPKAVAFVIVIDVSRAGGLQKDRVWKNRPKYTVVPYIFIYQTSDFFVHFKMHIYDNISWNNFIWDNRLLDTIFPW